MVVKKAVEESVEIVRLNTATVKFAVLGRSPLIHNSMANKVIHELLLPKGKKTAAEKQSSLKHDPRQEFLDSMLKTKDDKSATRIKWLATTFKKSLASAAIDIPGAMKSQIGRLTLVEGSELDMYGIPEIFMAVTRSADMNRTPDIRTRAIMAEWACYLSITFASPIIKENTIVNLLSASGIIRGVGDWRPEKGSGSYGQFELVSADDSRFLNIIKNGGRAAQDKALKNPTCYDLNTEELMAWFDVESKRRGFKVA